MAVGIERTEPDLAKLTSSLAATSMTRSSPKMAERILSMDFLHMSYIFGNSWTT
jgi:hypothetical protein